MNELIANARTMNAAPAREERLSKRLAERVGVRLLARGGQRYVDAVLEGLGHPGEEFMACDKCKRPFVQEWAVREMGHAMNRAMGHPQVQVQMLAMIQQLGVRDEAEARLAIAQYREAEAMDPEAAAAWCLEVAQKFYAGRGKRVMLLDEVAESSPNGSSAAAEAK